MPLQHEYTLNPVTALGFYHRQDGTLLLLAGEGPYLKVFDVETTQLVYQCKAFEAQAIHGLALGSESTQGNGLQVVIWGGSSFILLRKEGLHRCITEKRASLGERVMTVSDWILDAAISPHDSESCVLITAHNTVLLVKSDESSKPASIRTLSSPSRSILYSSHLLWESPEQVLIAAGTVFGEIIVWQCAISSESVSQNRVLYVLTGHEGSVFGVDLSPPLVSLDGFVRRLLASCSDDRTIRIWDISPSYSLGGSDAGSGSYETAALRETGFGDNRGNSRNLVSRCIATAMAHASRIWHVKFQVSPLKSENVTINILSSGEDSTTQQWILRDIQESTASKAMLYKPDTDNELSEAIRLEHQKTFSFHSGKHIWSIATITTDKGNHIATGGADGKVSLFGLMRRSSEANQNVSNSSNLPNEVVTDLLEQGEVLEEYDLEDVLAQLPSRTNTPEVPLELPPSAAVEPEESLTIEQSDQPKKLKKAKAKPPAKDVFNRYAFVDEKDLLLTTTFGRVLVGRLGSPIHWKECMLPEAAKNDLRSYSIIKSVPQTGVAFLAGASGRIFMYSAESSIIEVGDVGRKVADLFTTLDSRGEKLLLLVTTLASPVASLVVFSDWSSSTHLSSASSEIALPEKFVVTSFGTHDDLLILGSRRGSVAIYGRDSLERALSLWELVGDTGDAITSVLAIPGSQNTAGGRSYFLSTCRNGMYYIFSLTITRDGMSSVAAVDIDLVHSGTPPLGPMIEMAWFEGSDLYLYGFKSKNFIVWNECKQAEVVTVNCGGAHRSYSYSALRGSQGAGHFAYTKVSKLYIHTQTTPSHRLVKLGGHGREIKACAVSPDKSLIATGAEDTSIRVWSYHEGQATQEASFQCLAVIQKHTAGIQCLQWLGSRYLFSSAGNEEFFVWVVESIPGFGIGVTCEAEFLDRSEDGDLRIMSFDVTAMRSSATEDGLELLISLAYSDSTFRTYVYSKESEFRLVATRLYTSCCLTQVRHVGVSLEEVHLLTAATDGSIVYWRLSLLQASVRSPGDTIIPELEPVWIRRLHQSTIKCLGVVEVASGLIVVTGGDDNGLVVTALPRSNNGIGAGHSVMIRSAHAAAITGLSIVEEDVEGEELRVVSSSNDQRVKQWRVHMSGPSIRITSAGDRFTSVADVGDVAVIREQKVLVVGNGMDVWEVS